MSESDNRGPTTTLESPAGTRQWLAPPGGTYSNYTLQTFVARLAVLGSVTAACEDMRLHRTTLYKMRNDSPALSQAWAVALAEYRSGACETLEGAVVEFGKQPTGHADRKLFLQTFEPAYREAAKRQQSPAPIQDNRSLTIIQQATPLQLLEAKVLAHAMLMGRTSDGPAIDVSATLSDQGPTPTPAQPPPS